MTFRAMTEIEERTPTRDTAKASAVLWGLLLVLGQLALAVDADAATRRVRWSHPAPDQLTGFRIDVGPSSGSYDRQYDVGMPEPSGGYFEVEIEVPDGRDNYVAVVAINDAGEAPPSEVYVRDASVAYRVNFGTSATMDFSGQRWEGDAAYNQNGSTANGGTGSSISGTQADELYWTVRWGGDAETPMSFEFPLADGTYRVTLHWAETWEPASTRGARRFDVEIERERYLLDFDVGAEAGFGRAMARSFKVPVSDGSMSIDFYGGRTAQTPFISAIEIHAADADSAWGVPNWLD